MHRDLLLCQPQGFGRVYRDHIGRNDWDHDDFQREMLHLAIDWLGMRVWL
jgi:hypothetical protein